MNKWHCAKCGTLLEYDSKHSSIYCPKCDEWLDERCRDRDCPFCLGRPDKPSQIID